MANNSEREVIHRELDTDVDAPAVQLSEIIAGLELKIRLHCQQCMDV